uniref:Chorein N-terminal domain-containing protein n=1 Tax=Graphocephala atropunctata TaxID=36148 RepID=A0A1B6L4K0_9HEMI
MFRIESYITSIILSYVDRYIKNFRQQDAQVSLWEGDGSFQNLNLDLDVLEQELNLPFSFVSGHIHELLIHVPWTRLTSEPVQITINTIECVMKLKPVGSHQPATKSLRKSARALEDPQSQSSLMSSLVNKIICNLSVTCNNLILKYVEEDIVLSMNIKTLSFGTVNHNWNPAFIELSPTQLELRKLISLSDVTVCLDKRNASGRIESYLEPLLYRCFMTVRLWQRYPAVSAKRATSTRLDILCERMAFTVSEPQVPMLLRLMALCLALHRKELSHTSLPQSSDDSSTDKSEEDVVAGQAGDPNESWSSWALSWMPTLIPLAEDSDLDYDMYSDLPSPANSVINLGFYINTFTLAIKLCESDGSGGLKTQPQAFLHILLKGCRMDLLSHNSDWTNLQMGISQASVKPDGDCCCGLSEPTQMVYLSSGSMLEEFLSGSLFDKVSSHLEDRIRHSWKYHLESVSETIMLERTPALAVDYLSCVQDKTDEEDSDDEDNERLPAKEKVVIRYVAGPVVIRVCSGLIHRIQMMMKACSSYDYVPYSANTVLPVVQDNQVLDLVHRLSEKSIEMDEDLYSRYLPVHTAQFTAFNTVVELYPANHLPVHLSSLGRKLSRTQRRVLANPGSPPPCVTVEWKCVYATLTRPLYPDKILLMASKFHRDKMPLEITNTSLTRLAFKAVGVSSSVRLPFLQAMKVVEMSSVCSEQTWHALLIPLEDNMSCDTTVNIENVTITSSKAKLVLLYEIVGSLIATNNRQRYAAAHKTIYNSSLLHDAATTTDTIYLKLSVEQLAARRLLTGVSESTSLSMSACQLFVVRLLDRGDECETMIVAAPDTDTPLDSPLLEVLYQQPSSLNAFPPLLVFRLREMRFSADPLLYSWLLYTPTSAFPSHPTVLMSHKSTDSLKSRKVSESSLSSYVRLNPTTHESGHSSSERETTPSGHPSSQPLLDSVQNVPIMPLADRVASYYPVWRTMIVWGEVSQVAVYLPHSSLASPTPHSMEEGLRAGLRQLSPPLQVAVVRLPSVTLRCDNHKQAGQLFSEPLPVRLPPAMWNTEKDNFPWTLTVGDLHCYTLHGSNKLPLLKPVSFNCTMGTKPVSAEATCSIRAECSSGGLPLSESRGNCLSLCSTWQGEAEQAVVR